MARKRYIETHSNYTLRKLHQTSSKGDIFESDLMTITEPGAFAPGQTPIYNESNFKLSFRRGVSQKLKHETGVWVSEEDIKALASNNSVPGTASYIKLRPNCHNLLDFACYGSAKELVRASLTDIISKFPGELYLTQEEYMYYPSMSAMTTVPLGSDDKEKWFIVENPFLLNITSNSRPVNSNIPSIRYFCESFREYVFIPEYLKEKEYISWGVRRISESKCPKNGELLLEIYLGVCIIRCYNVDGRKVFLHNYKYGPAHVRPNENYLTQFYNSLDDFEYVLINRQTNNTALLLTPKETPTGTYVSLQAYKWPTVHGWNIDFSSSQYAQYANSLLDIADIYDNDYSDNVVRSMTHEAIKNFDWTFSRVLDDDTEYEMTDPNPYRMESILRVYGRQFDNLKLYARGIKETNSVSYAGINDLPDYFLSDTLELSGWDVKNPLSGSNNIVTDILFPGDCYGYNVDDANNQFMKRLKLSSTHILNAKGTKRGIEMLLALFGYHSMDYYQKRTYEIDGEVKTWDEMYDIDESGNTVLSDIQKRYYNKAYDMTEYAGVAFNVENSAMTGYERCDNLRVREVNAYRDDFHLPMNANNDIDGVELQGLPVKPVTITREDNTQETYLVPWYDKSRTYSSYFQGNGGWGATDIKKTEVATFGPIEISSEDGFQIYDETQNNLHFTENIRTLVELPYATINTGDIYYVEDIAGIEEEYMGPVNGTYSHYFILEDEVNSTFLGEVPGEEGMGWRCVSLEEIQNQKTPTGKYILYLESIVNNNKGNNPHDGHNKYDGGEDYINSYFKLFDDYTFEKVSDTKIEDRNTLGFDIEIQEDNLKCWYFTDTTKKMGKLSRMVENPDGSFSLTGDTYMYQGDILVDSTPETCVIGEDFVMDNSSLRNSSLIPYNMEGTGVVYDEAAANSIINLKNFFIDFHPDVRLGFSQYDFLNDVVLYYVKQMIPSTALFKYHIPDVGFNGVCGEDALLQGVVGENWATDDTIMTYRIPYMTTFILSEQNKRHGEDKKAFAAYNTNDNWDGDFLTTELIPNTDTNDGKEQQDIEAPEVTIVKNEDINEEYKF